MLLWVLASPPKMPYEVGRNWGSVAMDEFGIARGYADADCKSEEQQTCPCDELPGQFEASCTGLLHPQLLRRDTKDSQSLGTGQNVADCPPEPSTSKPLLYASN